MGPTLFVLAAIAVQGGLALLLMRLLTARDYEEQRQEEKPRRAA